MEFGSFFSLLLYLSVIYVSSTLIVIADKAGKQNRFLKFVLICIAIVIPSIMAGVRSGVGTDFANYDYRFTMLRNVSWSRALSVNNAEIGFIVLSKFLSCFMNNPWIFGSISFITLTIFIVALEKQYSVHVHRMMFTIYLLQYYFFSYNLVRQNIALAIVFFSMTFILNKSPVKFFLTIAFASLFHVSALIYIPAYFIMNRGMKRSPRRIGLIVVAVSLMVAVNFRQVIHVLLSFDIPYLSKFAYLINNTSEAQNRDIIVKILFCIVLLLFQRSLEKIDSKHVTLITFYLVGTAISITGFVTPFFKRIAYYYSISELELMSNIPFAVKDRKMSFILKESIILVYILLFVLVAFVMGQAHLIPYKTI